MAEIDCNLSEARKHLKTVQKNAAAARDIHLEEIVAMRLKNSNGDLAAVVTNTKHCEEMKLAFKQMKPITKGPMGEVVREIHVPNPTPLKSLALYDQ
eukprot:6904945-Ditylum_brightwellii.AAC.1